MVFYLLDIQKQLKTLPGDFWLRLSCPSFSSWDSNEQNILFCTPTGSRDFSQKPHTEKEGEMRDIITKRTDFCSEVRRFGQFLNHLDSICTNTEEYAHFIEPIRQDFRQHIMADNNVLAFWNDFENYLRESFARPGRSIPKIKCVPFILEECQSYLAKDMKSQAWKNTYTQVSRFLFTISSMIYIAARLILLVLLLTSLRAVPKGVYEDTPWTRFLPNFS